jgi:hypothetical protein
MAAGCPAQLGEGTPAYLDVVNPDRRDARLRHAAKRQTWGILVNAWFMD